MKPMALKGTTGQIKLVNKPKRHEASLNAGELSRFVQAEAGPVEPPHCRLSDV